VAPRKGLKDFDENLKKAGAAIGQLLARSQAKLEKTGRQALKTTGKLVDTMTKKAGPTLEATGETIPAAPDPGEEQNKKNSPAGFKPIKNNPINISIRLLGEEIIAYLTDNGKTTTAELQMIMGRRRRNQGMVFAALGWLAAEGKVHITRDGNNIGLQ
jgi:hypothetical protein